LYSDCFEGSTTGDSRSISAESKGTFTLDEVTDLEHTNDKDLVRPCDIKGILHSHSSYTDGAHNLPEMVEIAREIGLEYLGISDHFHSDAHRDGLDLPAVKEQRQEVDMLREKFPEFDILQGVEMDANPDGTLPVDDDTLHLFDYVIVSFPELEDDDNDRLTERVIRVAANPQVTILSRPVGDCILKCENEQLNMERVLTAAAAGGTAVELNANPNSLQLDWKCCRQAQEMGVYLAISPNAHRAARLVDYRHGAELAQEAGLRCGSILNTLTAVELRQYLS